MRTATRPIVDDLAYRFVMISLGATGCAAIFCGLYLVKSFMGIDLFEGPSFMHHIFFD